MDYSQIGNMVADVVKQALPIGIIFILAERLVQMFLMFAFPKIFKGGIQMYDYYYTEYFKTLISNTNTIISIQNSILLYLQLFIFIFTIFLVYYFVRNMLNRRQVLYVKKN